MLILGAERQVRKMRSLPSQQVVEVVLGYSPLKEKILWKISISGNA